MLPLRLIGGCVLAAVFGIASAARAQESTTFSLDVNVVNILATVRDRDGGIVNDLPQEAFILEEDGEVQEIRLSARQTYLLLTISLLVDTSLSQRRLLEEDINGLSILRIEKPRRFLLPRLVASFQLPGGRRLGSGCFPLANGAGRGLPHSAVAVRGRGYGSLMYLTRTIEVPVAPLSSVTVSSNT